MSNLFLTANDLHELTGYRKPCKQIAWLRAQGFMFRVAADGPPRVDRNHYLKVMGAHSEGARQKTVPDFEPLRQLQKAA